MSLICCVFEGAARKWAFGDDSIAGRLAYLSKDIVLAAFLFLGLGRGNLLTELGQPFLLVGLLLVAMGAVLSSAGGIDPVGALLTIRTFFILPVACWIGGRHLPADALRRFAMWIAILSLPLAGLGVLQFYSPSTSWINRYSTQGEHTFIALSAVSDRVRTTGTFSYISGFGEFATIAVWAGIVTFTLAQSYRARLLGYAALAAGLCCGFTTVSRAVTLISMGLIGVWSVAGGEFGRKAQIVGAIAALGFAGLLFTQRWEAAEEIVTTVYQRHQTSTNDNLVHRIWYHFILPLDAMTVAPFGNGLGSEQAGRSSNNSSEVRQGWTFESPWGRTVMELGVPGVLGFLATCMVVFLPLKTAYGMRMENESRTALAVTAALLVVKALLGFQFNHVAVYFFWATSATVLALGSGIRRSPRGEPVLNLAVLNAT